MLAHHIVPDAVELLKYAQADGQYAAATLLFNMASYHQQARGTIAACQAVEPLVRLLCHDSWCGSAPSSADSPVLTGGLPARCIL